MVIAAMKLKDAYSLDQQPCTESLLPERHYAVCVRKVYNCPQITYSLLKDRRELYRTVMQIKV